MRITLPNSANLQNITGLLRTWDLADSSKLIFSMHPRWVAVHPVVLAMTACLASRVLNEGGSIEGSATSVPTLPYLIRMGLFDYLQIDPKRSINSHEESGRFIPITQIRSAEDLKKAITDLVPLLHATPAVADPIKYVFSEMVRNSIEHSQSASGVFICAQYYRESNRIAIGIADAGVGVYASMKRFHNVHSSEEALTLALQPGITGATSRFGGNESNAGAGLFFTKSISVMSRNRFMIYSGESMFRLMQTPQKSIPVLHADPRLDPHKSFTAPNWQGTVVGIDLSIERDIEFAALLEYIRKAYFIDVKQRKDFSKRIRFT